MIIQSDNDRRGLHESARILSAVLRDVVMLAEDGVTTADLDEHVERGIRDRGGAPSFKGYGGFPASLCVSINDEIVHGVPGDRVLSNGDVVGLDVGVVSEDYYTDAAVTVVIGGSPLSAIEHLLFVTQQALRAGIAKATPGNTTGDIGSAIADIIEGENLGLVRELIGHGVGRAVHESPSVPNFGTPGEGDSLRRGMVLAIEPMATLGRGSIQKGGDGQSYVTADGSIAAHFEHTVIVDNPPVVLTEWSA